MNVKLAIFPALLAVVLVPLLLSGCNDETGRGGSGSTAYTAAGPAPDPGVGQSQILAAQNAQARKVEVTVDARVYKLLPDDTDGRPHQRFLLLLNNGTTVLVAHNTSLAPRVPLREGDLVRVHGEYIYNNKGGVLHFTHHSTGSHEAGWIEHNGQRYQ